MTIVIVKRVNAVIAYSNLNIILPTILGIGVWIGFYWINNLTDPQSYANYWLIGYPIFIVAVLIVSMITNNCPVMFGFVTISIQIVLGLFFLTGDLTQLPIGLIFHLFILIPVVIAGYLGKWLRGKILTGRKKVE